MRRFMLALAGATALTAASAASAAVTIGSTGGTNGSLGTTANVTDPVGNPNKVEFDTTNAVAGAFTSWFNFFSDSSNSGVFSVTTATDPASSVSLLQLFTGGTMTVAGSTPVASNPGSGTSGSLISALLPNTWYTFQYSGTLATAGDVSGPASFYVRSAVPEPATWGLMLLGFAGMGLTLRRRRRPALAQIA